MKRLIVLSCLLAIVACTSDALKSKKTCGDGANYSHFVNFPAVERAAERCMYAYESDSAILAKYSYGNRLFIKTLSNVEIKYFIIYDDMKNTQHIAIRGTDNFENVKTDARFKKVHNIKLSDYQSEVCDSLVKNEKLDVWVHKGFNIAANAIYKDIVDNDRLEPRYITTVTGHSLGGAAALLVYLNLHVDGVKLDIMYTFGQPKALTTDGVMKFRCIPYIRFVNEDDLVPLVPPSRLGFGLITSISLWRHGLYRHVGDEVILLKDSNYVYLEYHDAERLRVSSFWRSLGKRDVSLHDHHIPSYLKNLQIKKDVITERKYKDRKKYD